MRAQTPGALLLEGAILLGLAGCVSGPGATGSSGPSGSTADLALGVSPPPVDTSIAPVSLSNPSPEARQVLDLCQVTPDHVNAVAGMGQIPHARDATHYAGLVGVEPQIQTDAPAWIVQLRGPIDFRIANQTWIDPVCIVVNGAQLFYAVGPTRSDIDGTISTPLPAAPPDRSLPPLAP